MTVNGVHVLVIVLLVFGGILAWAYITDRRHLRNLPTVPAFVAPFDVDAEHRSNIVEMFRVKP